MFWGIVRVQYCICDFLSSVAIAKYNIATPPPQQNLVAQFWHYSLSTGGSNKYIETYRFLLVFRNLREPTVLPNV